MVYSTYLGGTAAQYPSLGIAVDASGRAYVSGTTEDPGFPVVNAYQPTYGGGGYDAFITVLNPAGNALEWSTYLGGNYDDRATAMALDPSGNVYVTGVTWNAATFPELHSISGTQCQTNSECIWMAKFSSAGTLQYATKYSPGWAWAIAADANGSAYVTGVAVTNTPPITPGAFRSTCIPGSCGFVAKLSPIGDSLIYSTTLGTVPATGEAIAVDSGGDAYVGGAAGPGLTVWSTGFQRAFGGGSSRRLVIQTERDGDQPDLVNLPGRQWGRLNSGSCARSTSPGVCFGIYKFS